ncbi:uncharacterized protein LOC114712302 [Neltuma alba]|uniref:uncharacterized protein LOC114712302 n=1 Tax=Neltuma alba TaxID=207710 RepID=UPI0010A3208F|nr:uncharacterized protein LOC114712302 [Prosopis alba]
MGEQGAIGTLYAESKLGRSKKINPQTCKGPIPLLFLCLFQMIVASWNCQGAGSKTFPRLINEVVKKYRINIMGIMEPRISGARADKVVKKMGFSNWIRVESTGYAGGIWVLWNDWEVSIEYVCSTTQLLHCKITSKTSAETMLATFVYGDTNPLRRRELWNSLRNIASSIDSDWMVLGDFNTFLTVEDKVGGTRPDNSMMISFRSCIDDCNLLEIPVVGDRFTWERNDVKERLDWAFRNFNWEINHPHMKAHHKLRFKSNHRMIVVSDGGENRINRSNRVFKYQAAWCLEQDFVDIVAASWENKNWLQGCESFKKSAMEWNEKVVGSVAAKKKKLLIRLEGIDKARQSNRSNGLQRLEKRIWEDYSKLAAQEELIWFQKSRSKWLKWGDKNTSFFHATTVMRKKRNSIEALQDSNGS